MSLKLLATKQFSANKLLCSEITTKEFAYSQHSAAQSKKCVLPLFLLNSSSSTFLSSFLRQTNHSCMTWDISAYTSKSKIRLLTFTQKKPSENSLLHRLKKWNFLSPAVRSWRLKSLQPKSNQKFWFQRNFNEKQKKHKIEHGSRVTGGRQQTLAELAEIC